jgi:hypothetical protein
MYVIITQSLVFIHLVELDLCLAIFHHVERESELLLLSSFPSHDERAVVNICTAVAVAVAKLITGCTLLLLIVFSL